MDSGTWNENATTRRSIFCFFSMTDVAMSVFLESDEIDVEYRKRCKLAASRWTSDGHRLRQEVRALWLALARRLSDVAGDAEGDVDVDDDEASFAFEVHTSDAAHDGVLRRQRIDVSGSAFLFILGERHFLGDKKKERKPATAPWKPNGSAEKDAVAFSVGADVFVFSFPILFSFTLLRRQWLSINSQSSIESVALNDSTMNIRKKKTTKNQWKWNTFYFTPTLPPRITGLEEIRKEEPNKKQKEMTKDNRRFCLFLLFCFFFSLH